MEKRLVFRENLEPFRCGSHIDNFEQLEAVPEKTNEEKIKEKYFQIDSQVDKLSSLVAKLYTPEYESLKNFLGKEYIENWKFEMENICL